MTSKEKGPTVGPNPDLYDRLSEPYADRSDGDEQMNVFMRRVQELREEYGIPDVLLVCSVHFVPAEGEKETIACKAIAYGHPDTSAQLGALAFQAYTLPVIRQGDKLRAMAKGSEDRVKWGDRTKEDEE